MSDISTLPLSRCSDVAVHLPFEGVRRVICDLAETGLPDQMIEHMRQRAASVPGLVAETRINDILTFVAAGIERAARNAVRYGLIFNLGRVDSTSVSELHDQSFQFSDSGKLPHPAPGYAFTLDWDTWTQFYVVAPLTELRGYVAAELGATKIGSLLLSAAIVRENIEAGRGLCVPVYRLDSTIHDISMPVAAFRMLLSTRGVPVKRNAAPEKLNKARAKLGRSPIPGYWSVDATRYATALRETRRMEHEDHGGTHASPRPHLRRGHVRRLSETRTTVVRSAIIGFKGAEEANVFMRSHYDLTRGTTM